MKQVDIIGTCFSRELFNYTNEYKVKTYIMQQSIYTLNSNPYKIDVNQINITDNYPFKVRMIYYDFNKIAFDKIQENPSEYLIVDLADQTRDIVILDEYDNVRLTATSAILETLNNLNIKYHLFNIDNYTAEELFEFIKEFVKKITTLYDHQKIILNKLQLQNEYYENNEKKYIDEDITVYRRRNKIELLQKFFLELLPDCKIVYSKYQPIIDINHRLGGPHPGHFEGIYYKYRMDLLDATINNKDTNKIDEIYKQEFVQAYSDIKKKIKKLEKNL